MYNRLFKSVLVAAFLLFPLMLTAGKAERKAADELLKVSQFEKVMDDSINFAVQTVKQMDPNMGRHEAILRKFYAKYMSAETLRKDVIDLYSENFTEKELKEITAFYNTKAGQKALEKLPEIMKGSMQIAQTRVMQNMSELQNMISQSNVILTK